MKCFPHPSRKGGLSSHFGPLPKPLTSGPSSEQPHCLQLLKGKCQYFVTRSEHHSPCTIKYRDANIININPKTMDGHHGPSNNQLVGWSSVVIFYYVLMQHETKSMLSPKCIDGLQNTSPECKDAKCSYGLEKTVRKFRETFSNTQLSILAWEATETLTQVLGQ